MTWKHFEILCLKFLFLFGGCYLCFFLQAQWELTAVTSAALVGFAGTLLPESRGIEKSHVHASVLGGALLAVGLRAVHLDPREIMWVSLVGVGIYFCVRSVFTNLGVRIGFIALISGFLAYGVRRWW